MVRRYLGGRSPAKGVLTDREHRLVADIRKATADLEERMERLEFHRALETVWGVINAANKYLDDTAPWTLAKDPSAKGRLETVLYSVLETLRISTIFVSPFMPGSAERIWEILGLGKDLGKKRIPEDVEFGLYPEGVDLPERAIVFPRIE